MLDILSCARMDLKEAVAIPHEFTADAKLIAHFNG
jgi:hypothetical protein